METFASDNRHLLRRQQLDRVVQEVQNEIAVKQTKEQEKKML